MSDEVREIQLRWVADADEVLTASQRIRDDINAVKLSLSEINSATGETTAALKETFRATQIDPLIAKVKELKATIATKESRTLLSEEEIAATRTAITLLENQIKRMQTALRVGNVEINQTFAASKQLANSGQKAFASATNSARAYTDQVKLAKAALTELIAQGFSLKAAMQGLKSTKVFDTTAINEASQAFKKTDKSILDLGNTAQRVFRSIMGFIVLGILRQIITSMSQLIDKAKEFNKAVINLSIAARAAQRSGLDVTFEELATLLEDLKEKFGIFTAQELRKGLDQLVLFGKETTLTKDQILGLSDAIAAAAVVTGLDFETAINRVMRALTTGQTRGLLEAGFAITELMVKEEAYAEELAERGKALSDVAKQQAMFNLIMDQSNKLMQEAEAFQDTLLGQLIQEESTYSDLSNQLGNTLLPFKLGLMKVTNTLVQAIFDLGEAISVGLTSAIRNLVTPLFAVVAGFETWKSILDGNDESIDSFIGRVQELRNSLKELQDQRIEDLFDPQGLPGDILTKFFMKEVEGVEDAGDELEDELKDLFIKLREAIISGQQDVARENRGFFQDMFEDMQKFIFKMQQLAEKYAFDVAKVWRDFRDKQADVDRKYREKEIKAEKDFQEKMRRLRAQFLLDLEEALQERDARQIMRLIKRFRLNVDNLQREKELEDEERERQWREEQEDLARRRDQRLRDLALEHQFRTRQLTEQHNFERKLAWQDHQNKLREMDIRNKERQDKIIRQFKDEHDLTLEGAKAVADALRTYFGPSGQVNQIYASLLASTDTFIRAWSERINRLLQLFNLLRRPPAHIPGTPATPGATTPAATPIDSGISTAVMTGAITPPTIQTSPTLQNKSIRTTSAPTANVASPEEKMLSLLISLSPGLEAEIVNNALGQMADVIVETNRQKL